MSAHTPANEPHRDYWLSALGAALTIGTALWVSHYFIGGAGLPLLVASMGASAVLLYTTPSSPMSQPWPFVGSHTVSALVGVTCAHFIPDVLWAGPLAVGLAIVVMHYLRCLHPPGGATALVAVIGGPEIHALGYQFVLTPVALNVGAVLGITVVLHRLLHNHHYFGITPHGRAANPVEQPLRPPFTPDDLQAALRDVGGFVDVSQDDLTRIYTLAMTHLQERRLAGVRCGEVMSRAVVCAEFGTEIEEVWSQFARHKISGMPVVNSARHVIGVVTQSDVLQQVAPTGDESMATRLQRFVRRTPGFHAHKPEVAGQIMSSPAITVNDDAPMVSLIPLFDRHRIHHIPVVDGQQKLVGVLTRADVMTMLAEGMPLS